MSSPATAPDERLPSVLFVDDEPGILASLRRLLRPEPFRLHFALGGAEALQILSREAIDVIVSDMRMPEMDGACFLERARVQHPGALRLLMTGHSDMRSTIDAINRGEIYRYISKPWVDGELLATVRQALEQQQLKRENARLAALTREQNEALRQLNAELEDKVRERTAELAARNESLKLANTSLRQHFLVSVKTFSSLLEMRSGAVAGHARRVADLARRVAAVMGLPEKAQQDVFLAGLLHDVGKIGFPDGLLARPVTAMNADEQGRYRRHASDGANLVEQVEELAGAALLVRSHHERFDGQGFPDGLAGEAIPLGARILGVVNDYDGYQNGTWSEHRLDAREALAEIQRLAGRRHDPAVVAAFAGVVAGPSPAQATEVELGADQLRPGMVIARSLRGRDGALLLAADYILDATLVRQIQKYARSEGAELRLHIRADKPFRASNSPSEGASP
ncbi:MAG: response regulator [Rhodocyclaceae bacterium]|nr:response regulator [Rhodocyclaceae bacterium]